MTFTTQSAESMYPVQATPSAPFTQPVQGIRPAHPGQFLQPNFSSNTSFATEQLGEISDSELFRRCQRYGDQARYWRQKFAGLLPEVNRRRLYEKKGFGSIYEFAAKLAGMSREQVQRTLNLEVKFQTLPMLHTMLVNGEVSLNKLARVASIATPENEEALANQVQFLSQSALEVLVRDENSSQIFQNQNGSFEPINRDESVRAHRNTSDISLDVKIMALIPKLSEELKTKLVELDEKGLSVNELLLELLQKRGEELAQEKEELSREQEMLCREATSGQQLKNPSRYIPAKIRQHLKQEYGTKCAKPACHKAAENIHHTARWSLSKNHDPRYLAPLCKAHHEVAHMVDAKVQEYRMARRW